MESLKADKDALRPVVSAEDFQQVLVERDRLKARVESLAAEIVDARVSASEAAWLADQCRNYHSQVESLKNERDELDLQNDELLMTAQSLTDERNKLDERVSDLLLEIENLKDEMDRCRQAVPAAVSVQNQLPLAKIRDRVLGDLKFGKQSATYKAIRAALNQFVKDIEIFSTFGAAGQSTSERESDG